MTHLPGQPHYSTSLETGQPSPHETTLRAHSAPKLPAALDATGLRFTTPDKPAKKKPSKNAGGGSNGTQGAAIMPDNDPWGRERRRLMGLEPDGI